MKVMNYWILLRNLFRYLSSVYIGDAIYRSIFSCLSTLFLRYWIYRWRYLRETKMETHYTFIFHQIISEVKVRCRHKTLGWWIVWFENWEYSSPILKSQYYVQMSPQSHKIFSFQRLNLIREQLKKLMIQSRSSPLITDRFKLRQIHSKIYYFIHNSYWLCMWVIRSKESLYLYHFFGFSPI